MNAFKEIFPYQKHTCTNEQLNSTLEVTKYIEMEKWANKQDPTSPQQPTSTKEDQPTINAHNPYSRNKIFIEEGLSHNGNEEVASQSGTIEEGLSTTHLVTILFLFFRF